jgi:hypothetical protein
MKVPKKKQSFYIVAYLLELIIKIWRFEKFPRKSAILAIFSMGKSFA